MTTRNLTNVDSYNADIAANAARFAVSLFLGRGKYANAEATTLDEIKAHAERLTTENPKATAKPIIVAFDAEGNSTPIGAKPAKAGKAAKPAKAAPKAKALFAKKPDAAKSAPKAKAEKPAKEKAAPKEKELGKRAQAVADAESGKVPSAPDFSAPTHARFRKKLGEVEALVKSGDIKGLKAYAINPVSSSPKAICKYRDLAVIALEAKAKAAKAKAKGK